MKIIKLLYHLALPCHEHWACVSWAKRPLTWQIHTCHTETGKKVSWQFMSLIKKRLTFLGARSTFQITLSFRPFVNMSVWYAYTYIPVLSSIISARVKSWREQIYKFYVFFFCYLSAMMQIFRNKSNCPSMAEQTPMDGQSDYRDATASKSKSISQQHSFGLWAARLWR